MVALRCGAALVAAFVSLAPFGARAQYVVTFNQVGGNVVATGSGTIDTAGLSDSSSRSLPALVISRGSELSAEFIGNSASDPGYGGLSGPAVFTSALFQEFLANGASGDGVGIATGSNVPGTSELLLPPGYVSGTELSDTATWDGATFSSLGLLPGSYVWTWGSGADAGSFTLNVGSPVPEPGSLAIVGVGLAGLVAARRRRTV